MRATVHALAHLGENDESVSEHRLLSGGMRNGEALQDANQVCERKALQGGARAHKKSGGGAYDRLRMCICTTEATECFGVRPRRCVRVVRLRSRKERREEASAFSS